MKSHYVLSWIRTSSVANWNHYSDFFFHEGEKSCIADLFFDTLTLEYKFILHNLYTVDKYAIGCQPDMPPRKLRTLQRLIANNCYVKVSDPVLINKDDPPHQKQRNEEKSFVQSLHKKMGKKL